MKCVRVRNHPTLPPLFIKAESICERIALHFRGYRTHGNIHGLLTKQANQQPAGQDTK